MTGKCEHPIHFLDFSVAKFKIGAMPTLSYLLVIPGPNLDSGMTVEFSVAFYSPTLHIYYLSLYWPDLKHLKSHVML